MTAQRTNDDWSKVEKPENTRKDEESKEKMCFKLQYWNILFNNLIEDSELNQVQKDWALIE